MNAKFRIWGKVENKFVTNYSCGYSINNEGILLYHYMVNDDKLFITIANTENFIIQHCTGIYDINKKDIYEGDLVKTTDTGMFKIFGGIGYTNGEIKWLCESWKICQHYIGASYLGDYSDYDCCPANLEIIGNILENPELKSTIN